MKKRILADTNILFSALLFRDSLPATALIHVSTNHSLVLCDQNIAEFRDIVYRKKPGLSGDAEKFLARLQYEEIKTGEPCDKRIRDDTDQPIIDAAVANGVDINIDRRQGFPKHGARSAEMHDCLGISGIGGIAVGLAATPILESAPGFLSAVFM